MATLYVENVPDELYKALKKRAKENRKSLAAEVIELLRENIPTEEELKSRRRFVQVLRTLRSQTPSGRGPFKSAEEMIREDRER
jgi:plasmid stability protein